MKLVRRICLSIKTFHLWWSFPLFSWLECFIKQLYCKEKSDVGHYWGLNGWPKEDITIFPSYLAPISVKWLPVSERNARVWGQVWAGFLRITNDPWWVIYLYLFHLHSNKGKEYFSERDILQNSNTLRIVRGLSTMTVVIEYAWPIFNALFRNLNDESIGL